MDEKLNIDVGAADPTRRVHLWKEALRESIFGLDCKSNADSFQGTLAGRVLDQGLIARSRASQQTLSRTPELIRKSTEATVVLAFVADGDCAIGQDGGDSVMDASEFRLFDDSRPFEANLISDTVANGILRIPKSTLTSRAGPIDDVVFKSFSAEDALHRLTLIFAKGLVGSLDEVDTLTASALYDQLLDLLALTIANAKGGSVDPTTHRAALLLRVKAHIKAHLRDAELTIDRTSSALGISSRYINVLFATEHTSFGRYVLAQRLKGAHREVTDPRRAHTQLSELAYDWGFASPSHFGRVFKNRYGLTPREARMERASA